MSLTFIRCFLFGIILLIMMIVAFIVTFVYFEREGYYHPTLASMTFLYSLFNVIEVIPST